MTEHKVQMKMDKINILIKLILLIDFFLSIGDAEEGQSDSREATERRMLASIVSADFEWSSQPLAAALADKANTNFGVNHRQSDGWPLMPAHVRSKLCQNKPFESESDELVAVTALTAQLLPIDKCRRPIVSGPKERDHRLESRAFVARKWLRINHIFTFVPRALRCTYMASEAGASERPDA